MFTTTVGQLVINESLPPELRNYERVLDKKEVIKLMRTLAVKYPDQYVQIVKKLGDISSEAVTETGGTSFGLAHLLSPQNIKQIKNKLQNEVRNILNDKRLDSNARRQKIIEILQKYSPEVEKVTFEESIKEENPLAQQVVAGARGNKTNLMSLRASDLLYTDQKDNPVPVPILKSYSQGLSPIEYWASTYGARKGVVATKIAVQDAGFLSKQLNQIMHRMIVVDKDAPQEYYNNLPPGHIRGYPVDVNDDDNIGALLATDVGPYKRNTVITPRVLNTLRQMNIKKILVRSPIVSNNPDDTLYAYDVGIRERLGIPGRGEMVGLAAAQAISEPVSQGQLNVKHSGGVAGKEKTFSGFAFINQLIQGASSFPQSAAHSEVDGRVEKIEKAPAGGHYVYIGGQKHYVRPDQNILVKVGDTVEAGDVISDGLPNIVNIVRHKGIGEGRRYFINTFRNVAEKSNTKAHRRNIELLARGLINFVELDEEWGDYVPGDIVKYSEIEYNYQPRENSKLVNINSAKDKYLERPILHYTIGTQLKPSVIKELQEFGIKEVYVNDKPPPFRPTFVRGMTVLQHDPDWLTRMYGSGLKTSLIDALYRGKTSDELGSSFVPGLAIAKDFGRIGKVRHPEPTIPDKNYAEEIIKLSNYILEKLADESNNSIPTVNTNYNTQLPQFGNNRPITINTMGGRPPNNPLQNMMNNNQSGGGSNTNPYTQAVQNAGRKNSLVPNFSTAENLLQSTARTIGMYPLFNPAGVQQITNNQFMQQAFAPAVFGYHFAEQSNNPVMVEFFRNILGLGGGQQPQVNNRTTLTSPSLPVVSTPTNSIEQNQGQNQSNSLMNPVNVAGAAAVTAAGAAALYKGRHWLFPRGAPPATPTSSAASVPERLNTSSVPANETSPRGSATSKFNLMKTLRNTGLMLAGEAALRYGDKLIPDWQGQNLRSNNEDFSRRINEARKIQQQALATASQDFAEGIAAGPGAVSLATMLFAPHVSLANYIASLGIRTGNFIDRKLGITDQLFGINKDIDSMALNALPASIDGRNINDLNQLLQHVTPVRNEIPVQFLAASKPRLVDREFKKVTIRFSPEVMGNLYNYYKNTNNQLLSNINVKLNNPIDQINKKLLDLVKAPGASTDYINSKITEKRVSNNKNTISIDENGNFFVNLNDSAISNIVNIPIFKKNIFSIGEILGKQDGNGRVILPNYIQDMLKNKIHVENMIKNGLNPQSIVDVTYYMYAVLGAGEDIAYQLVENNAISNNLLQQLPDIHAIRRIGSSKNKLGLLLPEAVSFVNTALAQSVPQNQQVLSTRDFNNMISNLNSNLIQRYYKNNNLENVLQQVFNQMTNELNYGTLGNPYTLFMLDSSIYSNFNPQRRLLFKYMPYAVQPSSGIGGWFTRNVTVDSDFKKFMQERYDYLIRMLDDLAQNNPEEFENIINVVSSYYNLNDPERLMSFMRDLDLTLRKFYKNDYKFDW